MSLTMKYFVLKPRGTDVFAAASRKAMIAYAKHIEANAEDQEARALAKELFDWIFKEKDIAGELTPLSSPTDERGNFTEGYDGGMQR